MPFVRWMLIQCYHPLLVEARAQRKLRVVDGLTVTFSWWADLLDEAGGEGIRTQSLRASLRVRFWGQ